MSEENTDKSKDHNRQQVRDALAILKFEYEFLSSNNDIASFRVGLENCEVDVAIFCFSRLVVILCNLPIRFTEEKLDQALRVCNELNDSDPISAYYISESLTADVRLGVGATDKTLTAEVVAMNLQWVLDQIEELAFPKFAAILAESKTEVAS